MNILYTFNNKFVPQVMASATSIMENNKKIDSIHFFFMTLNVSDEVENKIKTYIDGYKREVSFIHLQEMNNYFDFDFKTTGWNPVILARLLLDKLLPSDIDRILYLDGDTIVRGGLSDLWNIDLGNCVLAMGNEPTVDKKRKTNLGLKNIPYYNSGVLLIDLKKWRDEDIGGKVISYYKENGDRITAPDQDAINGALNGRIYSLAPKYNYFNIYDQYPYWFICKLCDYKYFDKDVYLESKNNPVIIHYLGEERPWRIGNHHRFKDDYIKYLDMTPWANQNYEKGWKLYFVAWDIFNTITKPFPSLRYAIINSLIPLFLKYRSNNK